MLRFLTYLEQVSLVSGRISLLVLFIVLVAIGLAYMYRAISKGIFPEVRPIPGVDALEESVGRVAEVGGAIHFMTGVHYGVPGHPDSIAAVSILAHVARLAAQYDVPLITTAGRADMYPIVDSAAKAGATAAGKPNAYNPANVRFIAQDQWAYAAGAIGIIKRENIQTNLQFGRQGGSALMIAAAAFDAGAVQISGTTDVSQLTFLMPMSDYLLIGEEYLAAAAALRKDPVALGSIGAQDLGKAIVLLLIIIGVILETARIGWLSNLLKL